MISIVEPLCSGTEHAHVNAGLIQVVRCAFPDQPIAFYAELTHLEEVRKAGGDFDTTGIERHPVELAPRAASFGKRWRQDAALIKRVASANERGGRQAGHILVLQSLPTVLLAAAGLRALGVVRQPIRAVLHGYLNEAFGWRSRNPFKCAIDMRSALKVAAPQLQLIALDPGIAEAVTSAIPSVGSRISTVRLPLPMVSAGSSFDGAVDYPIHSGFLGLATPEKGFDAFVAAARVCKSKYGERVEFHAIGRLPTTSAWDRKTLDSCLATLPSLTPVPREQYDAQVARLHYVCLPYSAAHYTLSASGVLLDVLAHAKPVLAGSTPAVRELFATGSPGLLLDQSDRLYAAIEETIRTFSAARYEEQAEQMRQARETRSLTRLAEAYRAIPASRIHGGKKRWSLRPRSPVSGRAVPPVTGPASL